jgi:hypothetical protein
MTRRPCPQLPADIWYLIIQQLYSGVRGLDIYPDWLYVLGKQAYYAVKRYVQFLIVSQNYKFTPTMYICDRVDISITRRIYIENGKCKSGNTAKVVIKHVKFAEPITLILAGGHIIYIDTKRQEAIVLDYKMRSVILPLSNSQYYNSRYALLD